MTRANGELGSKKVLLYGAGEHATMVYRRAKQRSEAYGEVVAFIDQNIYFQGHDLFDLPIISWADAFEQYGDDFYIYITANERITPEILGFLQENNIAPERIINYKPVEKRLGCQFAENYLSVEPLANTISYFTCCNKAEIDEVPTFVTDPVMAAHPDIIHSAVGHAHNIAQRIRENKAGNPHAGCKNMRTQYYFKNRKIRTVNFSGFAPCNFKCCYCVFHGQENNLIPSFQQYAIFRNVLQQLEELGYIDCDTHIDMSNGEFSICKEGNQLVELVDKYPTTLFTNAYIFSPQAARALENVSRMFCSVDSGTPETFHKVKGVDGFERVSENLREYAKHGPVTLKYILLEELNDNSEDLDGFFKLADEAAVRVELTRDFRYPSTRFSDRTLRIAAQFIKHFRKQGKLSMDMASFVRSGERERLMKLLEEV